MIDTHEIIKNEGRMGDPCANSVELAQEVDKLKAEVEWLTKELEASKEAGFYGRMAARATTERDHLREMLRSMVESYDILLNDTPIGENDIARGMVRGAFITIIDPARKALEVSK